MKQTTDIYLHNWTGHYRGSAVLINRNINYLIFRVIHLFHLKNSDLF